jgi:hypothetical protein
MQIPKKELASLSSTLESSGFEQFLSHVPFSVFTHPVPQGRDLND